MFKMEHSFVVNRPVEEVFAIVTNIEKTVQWQSWAIRATVTSPGELDTGTQYSYVAKLLGRELESTGEVTAFDLNKRFAWKTTSGPMPLKADCSFESVAGGTKLTITAQGDPGTYFGMADEILDRVVRRQALADAESLKDLLESDAIN